MLRALIWLMRVVVFVLLLGLAIKNSGLVTLQFFFSKEWELPLVLLLLLCFATGALIGATVSVTTLYTQRREIAQLKTRLDARDAPADKLPSPPLDTPDIAPV